MLIQHKNGPWVMAMDWVTPVISGTAGVLGAAVGVFGGMVNAWNQRKLDKTSYLRKLTERRFMVYNEVLDKNGREPILEPGNGRGWRPDLYMEHVRPVLFRNFHLLDEKVRKQVRTIDKRLQLRRWGSITAEDVADSLEYMYYVELIALIEAEYASV